MRLQAAWGKIGIGVSLIIAFGSAAYANEDYTCMQLMYDHGLATSAQANCGYKHYNDTIIEDAAQCMAIAENVGRESDLKDALTAGITDFQGQYNEVGDKKRLCSVFVDEFDFIVRP